MNRNIHADEVATALAPEGRSRMGPRRVWFPLLWTLLIGGAVWWYWQGDADQDRKNSTLVIAYVVFFAGLSIWTARSSGLPRRRRWIAAAAPWLALWSVSQWGPIKLIANGNIGVVGWRWRWAQAPDELLKPVDARPSNSIPWNTTPHDYPAFLGGDYWAEVENVAIDVERLKKQPPELLWRRPIGAGWSGFAVVGEYAVTQEQRGETELVTCYHVPTGDLVWSHADEVRFDPSGAGALGGVGPRATPIIRYGRVFTHGATGIVNCLEASTGDLIWRHDTLKEFSTENITWGKSASPWIVDDYVIVAVGGQGCSLVVYDVETGELVWAAGARRSSYASPIVTEIGGVRQILYVEEDYLTARSLDDGAKLWEHQWPGSSDANPASSNPIPLSDNWVFLSKGYGHGSELIHITDDDDQRWTVETLWKKPVLKTKMSNVVVRDGFVYGIDDVFLSCVDVRTGRRQWKNRRRPQIGDGQIMIVGNQILVLSESGEVILVAIDPDEYREAACFPAIEGVTWNNPAVAGQYLLVRNATQAACFELPLLDEGADVGTAKEQPVVGEGDAG